MRTPNLLLAYKNMADNRAVSHVGLGITAAHVALALRGADVQANAKGIKNGEELDSILRADTSITHVAMAAHFIDSPFIGRLVMRFPEVQFTVSTHSNPAFLAVDKFAVRSIREQVELQKLHHNFHVSGNSDRFCGAISGAFKSESVLLPNLFPVTEFRPKALYNGGTLRLGLFGAVRQMKNLLGGAWAAAVIASEMGVKAELYMNAGRIEHGDGIQDTIRTLLAKLDNITLIEVPWRNWQEFGRLAHTMHLMLQPSFSESFNNVTADGVINGTPSVVGHAITWVPKSWRVDPDDVTAIAHAGIRLIHDKRAARNGYDALVRFTDDARKRWMRWLGFTQMDMAKRTMRKMIGF